MGSAQPSPAEGCWNRGASFRFLVELLLSLRSGLAPSLWKRRKKMIVYGEGASCFALCIAPLCVISPQMCQPAWPQDEEQKAGTTIENPVNYSCHQLAAGNIAECSRNTNQEFPQALCAQSCEFKWGLEGQEVYGPMRHMCPRMAMTWPNTYPLNCVTLKHEPGR